jgi:hypothetical protein
LTFSCHIQRVVTVTPLKEGRGTHVSIAVLVLLALVIAVFIGLGFVVKWLFIIAAIAALIWLILFFASGVRGRSA